jgi:CHAT domain-containing protein/tetratricopeptide (TPR) repeat protein
VLACLIASSAPAMEADTVSAPVAEALNADGAVSDLQLSPDQQRTFRVNLKSGEAADLVVSQSGTTPIRLTWAAAGSSRATSVLTEGGRGVRLQVPLLAHGGQAWDITVSSADGARAARATVALEPAHPIAAADRLRDAAIDAFAQAETMRRQQPAPSIDQTRAQYRRAAARWGQAGDSCAAQRTWTALASFEHDLGNAVEQQRAAIEALKQICTTDRSEQAFAARLLGSGYINVGDYANGARVSSRAVTLSRQAGDINEQMVALRNLGLADTESGQVNAGLTATRAAIAVAQQLGDSGLLASLRNDAALAYSARGEYALAIEAYSLNLDNLKQHPNATAEAVAWINLGVAYAEMGDLDQSFSAFDHAETAGTQSQCWVCLAELAVDRGDYLSDAALARTSYEHARDIAQAHHFDRQRAEALRGLGLCALRAGQWADARALFDEAIGRFDRLHNSVNESLVYSLLGDLDVRQNQVEAARTAYHQALTIATNAGYQAAAVVAYGSLARLARDSGALDSARREIVRAVALIESERHRIDAPDLRTSYFSGRRSYYEFYIDVLLRLDRERPGHGYAAQGLITAERVRARELQERLTERAIGAQADREIDAQLLSEESAAADRLRTLAYQWSSASSAVARSNALQMQIDAATRSLNRIRGRIRAVNPRYAELTHPVALSTTEIRTQLLDPGVSVLEYWLGESRSYVWVLNGDHLLGFELPARGMVEAACARLREQLIAPATLPESLSIEQRVSRSQAELSSIAASGRALGDLILPAAARSLLTPTVAVVPDGALQAVPFTALGLPESSGGQTTFVYLPSLTTLRSLRALPHTHAPPGAVAILADPVYRYDDERLGARLSTNPSDWPQRDAVIAQLGRLPYTRREAQAVLAAADAAVSWLAEGFDASRESATKTSWDRFSLVHFATHALLNERHPELSGIVLSLYAPDGHAIDGFLRINDIYQLRMPVELIVLSVCDSASGQELGAEGPASLARAFFYAGSHRVLASLWPVDDRATATLMEDFYRSLLVERQSASEALRSAQREVARDPRWAQPYYWAGFVLEGDWG